MRINELLENVVSEDAMMGKIEDSGNIVRILKKAHTVPFSDEKNWLLVDVDPAKGNKGLGLKWIPADTRFEWVRPYRDNVEQDVAEGSERSIYKQAYMDGYNGKSFNSPYKPGSDEDDEYDEGWHDGRLDYEKQDVAEGKVINTYLWHGSRQKIPMLEPRQSVDTGGAAGSNQNAIYATSDPKVAIAMGLTTPGSDTGMFPNDPQMVLFSGKIRKGENVYLHKLPMNGPDGKPQFVQGGNSREFHSIPGVEGIKPIEIKEIPVNKYLNLIRKATPADLKLRKKYMKQQGVAEDTLNEFDYNKHVKMLNAYMKKLGYSYIGHGTDAHVFSKEAGSVTKVLIPKSGDISTAKNPFLAFLNYCKKNAGNPHLPKFTETTKEPIQLGSEKFDQVVMERLQEVDPKYEDLLVSITDSIEDGKPLDPQYQPYIKFYQTLKSVMLTGRKLGFENDIITFQSVNIMQRGNTLVIIDPWTGKGQQGVAENFADGKNPQDKGDSKRHGIPKHASLSGLDKIGRGSGRKAQLARWQANMRRGQAK